jgi:tellurite resistance protein TehA-like permease
MGTGVISALAALFPYGQGSVFLKAIVLLFFSINLALFIFVSTCTILRYYWFPEVWPLMLRHPAQSLFVGCFAMGCATLLNTGLVINQSYGFGGVKFLYFLWAMWWLDSAFSFIIAFGMIYVMMTRQEHTLAKMTGVWLLPVVTLVVASSSGGNLCAALKPINYTLAMLSGAFSITMVVIGLVLAMMFITCYVLRLVIHGPPEPALVLSAFIPLGPLGQGGYSLLVAGADLAELFPVRVGQDLNFPNAEITGDAFQIALFCGAFVLWSMGIAIITIAFMTIFEVARKNKLPFGMAYWGLVFPHGVFAMLTVQLGSVLNSPFFKAFGAVWSIGVLLLWIVVFTKTIPVFIDGSIFKAPYLSDPIPPPPEPQGLGLVEAGGATHVSHQQGSIEKYSSPHDGMQYIYPGTEAKYLPPSAPPDVEKYPTDMYIQRCLSPVRGTKYENLHPEDEKYLYSNTTSVVRVASTSSSDSGHSKLAYEPQTPPTAYVRSLPKV